MATGGCLTLIHTISDITANVQDVMFNPARSQIAIRTKDNAGPIKVYDYDGNKVEQVGKGIPALQQNGRMSLDTQRALYLVTSPSHLALINMEGKLQDKIAIPGATLVGVTYMKDNDLYVLSDIKQNKLFLVDPNSKKVEETIAGSRGGPMSFTGALFLSTCNDLVGNPVVLLSDAGNHRVHLLELDGDLFHTYGSKGGGDAQLTKPMGVVVEDEGRVIVCDQGNKRVTSYWTEGAPGEEEQVDRWACLLTAAELGGEPSWIDMDQRRNVLALKAGNNIQIYNYSSR